MYLTATNMLETPPSPSPLEEAHGHSLRLEIKCSCGLVSLHVSAIMFVMLSQDLKCIHEKIL